MVLGLLACVQQAPVDVSMIGDPAVDRRVVAIGDVHGDFRAARRALQLAGVVDESNQWIGGDTVAVQLGDQLDRGDGERKILDWFAELEAQAASAGGAFYPLLGNHETMNVAWDFRYVTEGGWEAFSDVPVETADSRVMAFPPSERGRAAAFAPGGPYAMKLAHHDVIKIVDDTLFVHGGVLPKHTDHIDAINADVQAWIRGDADEPDILKGDDSPVWTRKYSDDDDPDHLDACTKLNTTLDQLGLERMVVAHTVQEQANPACDGRVWRIDVGMARYYGGQPAALEIVGGEPRLLLD